jgi:hypothetical protein
MVGAGADTSEGLDAVCGVGGVRETAGVWAAGVAGATGKKENAD